MKNYFYTIKTKVGNFSIVWENSLEFVINKVTLPNSNYDFSGLKIKNCKEILLLETQILDYISGKKVEFSYKNCNFNLCTPFQKKVLIQTSKILYGTCVSYKDIANKIGKPKSYRAVGNALSANPFPIIIPCHRVIKNNGALGNFGGGINMKKFLIDLEKR